MEKEELLKKFYGHSSFRVGQSDLIDRILSGVDVLGVMPTGAGKSVCYQIPALITEGLTIVISPLISLMEDQVTALRQMGINAAYLNSTLSGDEYASTVFDAQNGCFKILYVAPERLLTESFLRVAESVNISMVTVDEAHCVSQWGQDFRPSYMDIPKFIEKLSYRPVISAFTATATPEVKRDICKMLKLSEPFVLTTGFDRENLYFAVKAPKDKYIALKSIVDKHNDKFGIVYCSTRKSVEEVCRRLNADGYSATRYHAGLDDRERKLNQDDFVFDRKQVMVATNAFGMGIDKSNVSYVVHYNMPKNLEGYYQEAGRAGRDGGYAECTVLYAKGDVRTNQFLIEKSKENSELDEKTRELLYEKDRERLKQMTFYCTIDGCLRNFILRYFGERSISECGNCSNCLGDIENFDITVDAQKIISCVYRVKEKCSRQEITAVLLGTKSDYSKLSTYGIMKDRDKRDIDELIGYLLEMGFLRDYEGTIVLTNEANSFIKERRSLFRKIQIKAPQITAIPPKTELVPVDERLLKKLKELRASLARIQSVPAYVVFTDTTLRDMCGKLPKTRDEFLGVAGIGSAKCERYGEKFLYEIKKYVTENNSELF